MKFQGQNLQDKFILERYFRNTKEGVLIECGAYDGLVDSNGLVFENYMDWTCINIEANPTIFKKLQKNRPNSINLNNGLSDKNAVEIFNQPIHPKHKENFGNGSFSHAMFHKKMLDEQGCKYKEYNVECKRYDLLIDKICKENKIKEILLMVLDVEGYEINVIEGMKKSKFLPKVIMVEDSIVGFENLKSKLSELNYKFDIKFENNSVFYNL